MFSSCEKDGEERKKIPPLPTPAAFSFPPIKIMVEKEMKIHAFKYVCIKSKKHFVVAVYGKKKGLLYQYLQRNDSLNYPNYPKKCKAIENNGGP